MTCTNKKRQLNKICYFPKPYAHCKDKIKVELVLSNYTAKSDLKNAVGVGTSTFAKTADLVS